MTIPLLHYYISILTIFLNCAIFLVKKLIWFQLRNLTFSLERVMKSNIFAYSQKVRCFCCQAILED